MSLHDRIMGMKKPVKSGNLKFGPALYNSGLSDAAKIAKEADELIRRMGNVIAAIEPTDLPDELNGRVRSALNSYNNWKESTK